jgi:hypothetical protein
MKSIAESEDALFAEWRLTRPDLVTDGVVDEVSWAASRPKVLFLLKEVNSDGKGNWDLREQIIRTGIRSETWDNVTRWTIGIRSPEAAIRWDALPKINERLRVQTLNSIAVMNLKKSPGSHTTVPGELKRAAASDRKFIERQFFLYEADIVICCGKSVADAIHPIVSCNPENRWTETSRGVPYREYMPSKFLIEYPHPEARVADYLLLYGLLDAVIEIRRIHSRNW